MISPHIYFPPKNVSLPDHPVDIPHSLLMAGVLKCILDRYPPPPCLSASLGLPPLSGGGETIVIIVPINKDRSDAASLQSAQLSMSTNDKDKETSLLFMKDVSQDFF